MRRPTGPDVVRAPADYDDWQALQALLVRAFAYMHGRIDPPSSLLAMSADDLADKARKETLFLAMSDRAVVGCLFLELRDTSGYVGKLAVDAAWRGRGLARRLVALAEDTARTAGKRALTLQTRVELVENHATFARLGFVVTAHTAHDGYERPTSVTMERPIDLNRGTTP